MPLFASLCRCHPDLTQVTAKLALRESSVPVQQTAQVGDPFLDKLANLAQPTIDRGCARRKQAVRDSFELHFATRDLLHERIERAAMRDRGRETLDLFSEQFLAP